MKLLSTNGWPKEEEGPKEEEVGGVLLSTLL
jgi:hypothetical protein